MRKSISKPFSPLNDSISESYNPYIIHLLFLYDFLKFLLDFLLLLYSIYNKISFVFELILHIKRVSSPCLRSEVYAWVKCKLPVLILYISFIWILFGICDLL